MTELDRASSASEPGKSVQVDSTQWVDILDGTETDLAVKFILQVHPDQNNGSPVAFRLCTAAEANEDPDSPGDPISSFESAVCLYVGGVWEETQYLGPVCARSTDNETTVTKAVF